MISLRFTALLLPVRVTCSRPYWKSSTFTVPGSIAGPVTVQGILQVEDRWDGDWQLGLYWMEGAEVVK